MNTEITTTAAEHVKRFTLMAALLIGGLWPIRATGADINEQVARLDLATAGLDDVIRIFGEPQSYAWEGKTFTRDNLPGIYVVTYPNDFGVLMNGGRVGELRFGGPAAGYAYQGKLRVGSSLEEALAVLGPPASTVEGGQVEGKDGVLYKDVGGKKGYCYYSRADHHIRLFFLDNKVAALFLMGHRPGANWMRGASWRS
jgi:hypothetical protein